jgi:hypothetical protein
MARLIVEARAAEWTSGADVPRELQVAVSVSRENDGTPVTGLGVGNFRIAAQLGWISDFAIDQVSEWEWEPGDVELAGCYELLIGWQPVQIVFRDGTSLPPSGAQFRPGWRYVLGVQARMFDNHQPPRVVDQGQTIVDVISLGT